MPGMGPLPGHLGDDPGHQVAFGPLPHRQDVLPAAKNISKDQS